MGKALDAALRYATQKKWGVVPVVANTKSPPAEFPLSAYFNRPMTPEEINRWFSQPNVDNVGIVVGPASHLVVVDIDDPSKNEEFRRKYPTGLVARTPSGGTHLYYELPDGVQVPNGKLEPGVEVLAQKHYVVAAPSYARHSRNGREYSGSYEWLTNGDPAPLPDEITARLLRLDAAPQQATTRTGKYSRDEIKAMVNYAVANGQFQPGAHNDTVYYGTQHLFSTGWDEPAIMNLMLSLDRRDPSPQGDATVQSIVQRAIAVATRDTKPTQQPTQQPTQRVYVNPRERPVQFATLSYGEMVDTYGDFDSRWLVDSWMPESGVLMVTAPPERFKTWFAIDMAISVATGLPFLGQYEINKTGKVLVIQQEDFGPSLLNRFRLIERSKLAQEQRDMEFEWHEDRSCSWRWNHDLYTEDKIAFHVEGELRLDNPHALDALERVCEQVKPALVVIDPFYSLADATDYYASAAEVIRNRIKGIRNKTGAAFLFVHHTSKPKGNIDEGDPTNRQNAWGSQFLNAALEGMINLARPKGANDKTVIAYRRFKTASAGEPIQLTFDIDAHAETDENAFHVAVSGIEEKIDDLIRHFLQMNGPTTLKDLHDEFKPAFPSKSTFMRKLKEVKGVIQDGQKRYLYEPDTE